MCWTGYISDKNIATEDIKCRKIINKNDNTGEYVPYYMSNAMTYKIGDTYSMVIIPHKVSLNIIKIDEAFHAYSMDVDIKRFTFYGGEVNGYILKYFHSSNQHFIPQYFLRTTPVVVECVIPKGTVYYENIHGEIASESLKIVRIIDKEEIDYY